jgi:hypothetical protein
VNLNKFCECECKLCIKACEHKECGEKTRHAIIFCCILQKMP